MTEAEVEPGDGYLHSDLESLERALPPGGDHVAVLTEQRVDEWFGRLRGLAQPPETQQFISVGDTVRGATATGTQRLPGRPLSITPVERPLDVETFLAELSDQFTGTNGVLMLDDLSFLTDETEDPGAVFDRMLETAAQAGATVHAVLPEDPGAVAALNRRLEPFDETVTRPLIDAAIAYLRETDPTNHGYLRTNWREARSGIEQVEMCYPQASQVHDALSDPETSPRTLGAALGALVKLGVIDVWGETIAANRYDLTDYDPQRMAAVADHFSESNHGSEGEMIAEAD